MTWMNDDFGPVPAAYRGVWRRTLLEGDGLLTDTSSTVLWLQTTRWHADLRLPSGRPDFASAHEPAGCSLAQRIWLASQQGFFGVTEVLDDRCQWHHDLDFQPTTANRDIGTMIFHTDGIGLDEYGIDVDYHETWQRLPEGLGPSAAWCGGVSAPARLLVTGDCFFLVRPRIGPLPPDAHLAALVLERPEYLDFELSYGRICGAETPWRILHSTLPWREGESLRGGIWRCLGAEPGALAPPSLAELGA